MLGVETALWSTAAKKAGKEYRGVLEAAERFKVGWHEDEAQLRVGSAAHPPRVVSKGMREGGATGGVEGNPTKGMWGVGVNRRSRRETPVNASRKEMADRVARESSRLGARAYLCYSCRQLVQQVRTWSSFVFYILSCDWTSAVCVTFLFFPFFY